ALWIHIYQIDWESVALIGRTFTDVFPEHALASTNPSRVGSDYLLIGFKGKSPFAIEQPFASAEPAGKSPNMKLRDPRMLYRLLVSDNATDRFGPGPLNTDNRPLLEFNAPRQMHRSTDDARLVLEPLLRDIHLPAVARTYLDAQVASV